MEINLILVVFACILHTTSCSSLSYIRRDEHKRGLEFGINQPGESASNPNFVSGAGCGTVPIKRNQIIQIQSNNFGVGNYFNNDACTWTFTASNCALSVYCPCFDIPNSLGCLEDYLKIGHLHFHDKFCGENYPIGVYRASGDFLTLRFRSDYKETGKGFLCHVRCTATGSADPLPPSNVTCPPNTRNPFGVAA